MEWKKADPALIGRRAVYHGVKDKHFEITGVSADQRYYWAGDELFPSFLVEALPEEGDQAGAAEAAR